MINIDANIEDADWLKRTWDLPPYKSAEFLELFSDLVKFRKLPVYKFAVAAGLIVDDEWATGPEKKAKDLGALAKSQADHHAAASAYREAAIARAQAGDHEAAAKYLALSEEHHYKGLRK